jgi:DNA repair ATPase RecN
VKVLPGEEAVAELARIASGDMITPAALQSARELWEHAHEAQQKLLEV